MRNATKLLNLLKDPAQIQTIKKIKDKNISKRISRSTDKSVSHMKTRHKRDHHTSHEQIDFKNCFKIQSKSYFARKK